jgi:hypothetical protein
MPTDPAAVLHRLTERLAPLERSLHLADWAAATDARPETSAARQRAEEALLAVLAASGDAVERQAAWAAGKQVGEVVADDVLALVELRNRVARGHGFRDWFAFSLATGDLDEAWLDGILDRVELATREPFLAAKAAIDKRLAARFGVGAGELRPWHYGDLFFQRYDGDAEADLGPLLAGRDIVEPTVAAYDGMGLETRHLLDRADLEPRPGKDQHAFCLDIDRAGDIRVLANVAPGEESLDTMLHEVGHAAAAAALAAPSRQVLRTGQLVFALVPGDGPLRAGHLRRPRPRSGRHLVGPGRVAAGAAPAGGPHHAGLGEQDPPGRRPRLLPELPARRAAGLPGRRGRARGGRRLRRPARRRRLPGRPGSVNGGAPAGGVRGTPMGCPGGSGAKGVPR